MCTDFLKNYDEFAGCPNATHKGVKFTKTSDASKMCVSNWIWHRNRSLTPLSPAVSASGSLRASAYFDVSQMTSRESYTHTLLYTRDGGSQFTKRKTIYIFNIIILYSRRTACYRYIRGRSAIVFHYWNVKYIVSRYHKSRYYTLL